MSLTTRCPSCQTVFKVVPDQLRIANGWVRCGQCQAAFDAQAALLEEAPTTAADVTTHSEPAPDAPVADEVPAPPEIDALVPEIAADEVSFLRRSRAESAPSRALARATFVLCNLALMLVLLGQIVLHERDRLAASVPTLTPWLQLACGFANCRLSPLRNIDAIVIESSSFVKIEDGIYGLNFTLKNTSTTELALPAVELTLTDALDQLVLRRVLRSAEWGAKSDRLAVGLERPVTLTLALNGTSSTSPPVGYRLLAFYP